MKCHPLRPSHRADQFRTTALILFISFGFHSLAVAAEGIFQATNSPPPGSAELHAVGIYSGLTPSGGGSQNHERSDAAVSVNRPGKRVTLALSAYEPVTWHITIATGTTIERVILGGYYAQTAVGLPSGIEITPTYNPGNPLLFLGTSIDSIEFLQEVPLLCAMTGLDLSSYHGVSYAPYPAPIVIDSVQNDPRLLCGYPQPTPISELPPLTFQLAFQDSNSIHGIQLVNYSLAGPQDGQRLFPGPRLVPDASAHFYYGFTWEKAFRIDSDQGAMELLPLSATLPVFSYPTGMAYDNRRDRVLLVSFGGEGYLYGFSPSQNSWSLVNSMNNRDVDCLAYAPASDSLYAVAIDYSENNSLRVQQFDSSGRYLSEIRLAALPFRIGISTHRTQLVPVEGYLVLLIEPEQIFPDAAQIQESRIYLIEPSTGRSWLTYRRIHAPRNKPPTLQIAWPPQEFILPSNQNVPLIAQAQDQDGRVQSVEFFANGLSVGQARRATSPERSTFFQLDWAPPHDGSFSLTARAIDVEGAATLAGRIHLTLRPDAPVDPVPTHEVHAVGVSSASALNGSPAQGTATGHAAVKVDRPGKTVTLFLSGYGPVLWHVTATPGTTLDTVILGGYYRQDVLGLSSNVNVIPAYYNEGSGSADYFYAGWDMDTALFQHAQGKLCRMTGEDMSSFQGLAVAPYPTPFVIDQLQRDARLRCDFPRPIDPAQLPETQFRLAFYGSSKLFFQDYSLAGPRNGTHLLPAMRVVTDPGDRFYYGNGSHSMFQIDSSTSAIREMDLGPEVPELSWAIGVTFDSLRNHILLGSLVGEGYLYAYSPSTDSWSLVGGLQGLDLDSIAYHAADDTLYGVQSSTGNSGPSSIIQFTADGLKKGSFPLPVLPVSVGFSGARTQLVSVGGNLVLLVEWDLNSYPVPLSPEMRIYWIDPNTGELTLTFRSLPLTDSDGDGIPDGRDQCPDTPAGAPVDEHGCSPAERDTDHDGVTDDRDQCPNTPASAVVNESGCSVPQLCPCDADQSHGDHVRCVIEQAWRFYRQGLLTADERRALIQEAVHSDCGRDPKLILNLQPQNEAEVLQDGRALLLSRSITESCVLECSTDLISWTPVCTNRPTDLQLELIDRNAGRDTMRFYRLRLVP